MEGKGEIKEGRRDREGETEKVNEERIWDREEERGEYAK